MRVRSVSIHSCFPFTFLPFYRFPGDPGKIPTVRRWAVPGDNHSDLPETISLGVQPKKTLLSHLTGKKNEERRKMLRRRMENPLNMFNHKSDVSLTKTNRATDCEAPWESPPAPRERVVIRRRDLCDTFIWRVNAHS